MRARLGPRPGPGLAPTQRGGPPPAQASPPPVWPSPTPTGLHAQEGLQHLACGRPTDHMRALRPRGHPWGNRLARAGKPATHTRQRACLHGQARRTNRQARRPRGHHHCNRLARAGKPATHARQRACLQRQAQQACRPVVALAGTPIATGVLARADPPAARASGLARLGPPSGCFARAGPIRSLPAQRPPLQLVCPRAFAQGPSQQVCPHDARRLGLARRCPDLPGLARICPDFGPKTV